MTQKSIQSETCRLGLEIWVQGPFTQLYWLQTILDSNGLTINNFVLLALQDCPISTQNGCVSQPNIWRSNARQYLNHNGGVCTMLAVAAMEWLVDEHTGEVWQLL